MRTTRALLLLASSAAFAATISAQQLPREPLRESGQSVTPAYQGWYRNADGSLSLLVGYFNRSLRREVDIPIGPANHIDPGRPYRGQATHFLTRPQWGMFTIRVTRD